METYPSDIQKLIATIEAKKISINEATEIIKTCAPERAFNPHNEILLTVDYDKPLKQLIKEGGYHWFDPDINSKHFPDYTNGHQGKAEVLAKIFTFDSETLGEQALVQMHEAGYTPANLAELLTLGYVHPNLQRMFKIMSPGSIWRFIGMPNTPFLGAMMYPEGQKRYLSTGWFVPKCKIQEGLLGIHR
ncbi:MAG TPA: hypothetical protein PKI61_01265 [bacterium]|nr:hypothetical protein [bacterium]HPT29699.1 hypothetical protein [bacterium]